MQEIPNKDSYANIHFPQRINVIKKLRYVSFLVNDLIMAASIFMLLVWVINLFNGQIFLFQKLGIYPFSSVLFILSGTSLFFGAKRHLMSLHQGTEKEEYPWWNTWLPILLSATTAVLGLINFVHLTDSKAFSFLELSHFGGLCFFLIGLALIPPFTRILHRFHITQAFIFVVSGLNIFIILENIYQLFSPLPLQHMFFVPLPTAFVFVIFCFGVLLRWSNRGFFGNFTLDSTVSMFALRLLLINLIAAPLIAFIALAIMQKTSYNMYQVLTVVVALFAFLSSLLLWINMKLLYRYDLEYLLMRESLRTHNIDLTTEKETLRKRMVQLEQEKQQYLDKLNTQNTLRDVADTLR